MKKISRRSFLKCTGLLATAAALTACGGSEGGAATEGGEQSFELRLAHNMAEDHPLHLASVKFAEDVAAKTNGTVKVTVFPNAILGSEVASIEQLANGALDMCRAGGASLENFDPVFSAFAIPYLFESEEAFYKVMDSEIAEEVYMMTEPHGFIGLTYYDGGARSFYTNKEVNSPADLSGLKIRVMENPTSMAMMEALDASAVPLAYGDIYTALQQGVLDGAENNPTALTMGKHGEVAKFYCLDEHMRVPDFLIISTNTWNKLSADQQTALKEAAAESTKYHTELWKKAVEEALASAEADYGVTITNPDKKAFRDACAPLYEDLKTNNPDVYALVERILEYQAK